MDFRSDTVTKPTPEMRLAMAEAEVGDDVYGDDPTVNRLEAVAARMIGKEAAIFMPTGTMGNQAAIMAHTRAGQEIIAGAESHVIRYEAGGAARLSGVSSALVPGYLTKAEDIPPLTRPGDDLHCPQSRLVCLENALGDGRVMSLDQMKALYRTAREHGLVVHLDGARIFNAALALGLEAREIAAEADSVMFCLSKGLSAPVGSMVAGPAEFIGRARRARKLLGGGLRQAGVLAAGGLIALEKMVDRLSEDHANARYLGEKLAEFPDFIVDLESIQINIVYWRAAKPDFNPRAFGEFMARRGVKTGAWSQGSNRLVTHKDVSREEVDIFIGLLKEFLAAQ